MDLADKQYVRGRISGTLPPMERRSKGLGAVVLGVSDRLRGDEARMADGGTEVHVATRGALACRSRWRPLVRRSWRLYVHGACQ